MIRIAQRGWNRDQAATTLDEVAAGFDCLWVEIDGVRIPGTLISATPDVVAGEFNRTYITLEVLGRVELVYLDADGNELGTGDAEMQSYGYHTVSVR